MASSNEGALVKAASSDTGSFLLAKLTLSYLLVGGAVDLGASQTTCGGGVKLLSPTQQQVAAGGVTGPPGAVVAGLRCRRQHCWEEKRRGESSSQ